MFAQQLFDDQNSEVLAVMVMDNPDMAWKNVTGSEPAMYVLAFPE